MKKLIITLLLAAVSMAAFAKAASGALEIGYGPWVTNVTENSFDVLFTTPSSTLAWVEVAEDDGTQWYASERKKFYQTIAGRRACGTMHRICISGLKKGTAYRYRVFGKVVVDDSNPYASQFGPEQRYKQDHISTAKTLDAKADSCRFSMVNDIHFDAPLYTSLMKGMDPKSDFIFLCGDIVSYSSSIDSVMKYTFAPIKEQADRFAVLYARGNHEGRGSEWYKLPEVFPTRTGEFYYSFRQGPVAFVVLDAGEDKADSDVEYSGTAQYDEYRAKELEWLKEAVKSPEFRNAPHKVCMIHISTSRTAKMWYTRKWLADNLMPVLNDAGIELMLSGHDHKFSTNKPGEFGNNYTIITNDNKSRLDFAADSKSISVKIIDKAGNVVQDIRLGK